MTVKHFVANDSETDRFTVDAQVDERTLREMYLAPFETIVAAGAWGVMSSYNQVNGTTMSANTPLQRRRAQGRVGLRRRSWSPTGTPLATRTKRCTAASTSRCPPPGARGAPSLDRRRARRRGRRDRTSTSRSAGCCGWPAGSARSTAWHRPWPRPTGPRRSTARRWPARSRPVRSCSPRTRPASFRSTPPTLTSVALIGALAKDARVLGGGSARVFPRHIVSPLDGLDGGAAGQRSTLTYATGADPRTKLAAVAGPVHRDVPRRATAPRSTRRRSPTAPPAGWTRRPDSTSTAWPASN